MTLLGLQSRFWGHTTQILSRLSPKRDCCAKRVNAPRSCFRPPVSRSHVFACSGMACLFRARSAGGILAKWFVGGVPAHVVGSSARSFASSLSELNDPASLLLYDHKNCSARLLVHWRLTYFPPLCTKPREYHDLDCLQIFHLQVLTCRDDRLCRIYLHSTDPSQETCATVDNADCTAPTRQHELDHTDRTDHTDHLP